MDDVRDAAFYEDKAKDGGDAPPLVCDSCFVLDERLKRVEAKVVMLEAAADTYERRLVAVDKHYCQRQKKDCCGHEWIEVEGSKSKSRRQCRFCWTEDE